MDNPNLSPFEFYEHTDEFIKEDAILACMDKKGKVNLITIGWKTIGVLWLTTCDHCGNPSKSIFVFGA